MENLTVHQFEEWKAFDQVSPIGGKRIDFHFAHLISTIVNFVIKIHGKKGTSLKELKNFIPNWSGFKEQPKSMSPKEMKQFWINFAKQQNAYVDKQEKLNAKDKKK